MTVDVGVNPPSKPSYLGDGLYASYDGYQYRLFASDGINTTNEVFLDPQTLEAFIRYIKFTQSNDKDSNNG